MRVIWIVAAGVLTLTWAVGCHSEKSELELTPLAHAPTLLFDPGTGNLPESEFMVRSDWPSTASSTPLGETIFYQERFIDMQYSSPWGSRNHDRTYRRFSTVRTGAGVR